MRMLLYLGIFALIIAVVLWLTKALITLVFWFGAAGIVAAVIGLLMMSRRRSRSDTV
ncbi:hypothetical protein [Cohnella kolymensis]|uniref:hypothetical protein n=1 Tax=Cohnella kolymensis TaxID=1590652 RepID=UPI000AE6E24F|nr:hypothetical protein [Cohnella kolymensis]